jgi:hypothetical protein
MPRLAPQTIEDFHERIEALEKLDASGAPIEDLLEAIRDLTRGTRIGLPNLLRGQKIFRAVLLGERARMRSRISYPPPERVHSHGRLNCAGESLFYGCLPGRTPQTFEISCLYECAAQAGQRFVVGEWELTEEILVGHIGYSSTNFEGSFRAGQPWMAMEDVNPVISHIRRWQSNVFTRRVENGEEDRYRMSIALARWCMLPGATPISGFERISGVYIPRWRLN